MLTANLGIQFFVAYGESNEQNGPLNQCDDVTVEADFSQTAGPHDEVDDEAKSTSNCDSSEQMMASITTDTTLSEYGTSLGSFTLNGTMGELNAVSDRMSDITRMAGVYEAGVTVASNTGTFIQDSGETVTITWRALMLVPGEIVPA